MAYFSREQASVVPYLVGNRIYGGGRPMPTVGPVDPSGYRERDLQTAARGAAVRRRLKAMQTKDFGSADVLRTV